MKLNKFVSKLKLTADIFEIRPEEETGINPEENYEEGDFWEWFEDYVRSNGLTK